MFDIKQFASAIKQIAEEKGIAEDKILETIEHAIAAAYKKDYGQKGQIVRAKLNMETGALSVNQVKYVVEGMDEEGSIIGELPKKTQETEEEQKETRESVTKEVPEKEGETDEIKIKFNPEKHILLEEVRKIDPELKVGDELIIKLEPKTEFGRIAAQTAKQVIIQKLRELERQTIFEEFQGKEGEVVSGIVQRNERRIVYVDIGKTNGVLIPAEQSFADNYRTGQRFKLLVLKVEETPKGPMILLSRTHPKLVLELFKLEVPEIEAGTVEIKAMAREAGSRSKVAVVSKEESVDPIGSLVGQKGVRVQTIINELSGEKIDIIEWNDDPAKFINNALSPAKILDVKILDEKRRHALVEVADDQFSLAIGKKGQNVRLAAKLTGWKIDVRSPKEKLSSEEVETEETEEKAKDLAKSLGLPYVNLKAFPIDTTALFTLDEKDARSGELVIISKSGKNLKIAVLDPNNPKTQLILEKLKKDGFGYSLIVVSPMSLETAFSRYAQKKEVKKVELGVVKIKETDISELQKQIKDIADLKERLSIMPITKVLDILLAGALKIEASDIHFEPEEKSIRLRYRIDGVLNDVVEFDRTGYPQILSRIKLLAGLKINVHDVPQDGRFTIRQEKIDIEIRVSVLPGAYGENIVMRLLDPRTIKQNLEELGMQPDILEIIKSQLKKTTGAILTTGPTGSGKTTTLYAFIRFVNAPDVKIITIEDPVEYHIEGISQTQVDPRSGYTFINGLRSIVRQDPDVILVGEIRDLETAEIAMHAALTGHLVFSTLHTNDAAGTIPRLIDLGVRPVTIAPALNAAMAQRLIRRLCKECKKKKKPTSEELGLIKKILKNIPKKIKLPKIDEKLEIYYPQKCKECNFTGYKNRIGVYEVFTIDSEMEKAILKSPPISEIKELAIKKGMITMLQDGYIKIVEGITSIEEVQRVMGE